MPPEESHATSSRVSAERERREWFMKPPMQEVETGGQSRRDHI
jgi:hypothetical protein